MQNQSKIDQFITWWQQNPENADQIVAVQTTSASDGIQSPIPDQIHPDLSSILVSLGIKQLYSHQTESYQEIREGKNIVVSTGTASGKTLCYNLPVLDSILRDGTSRAMYIFPTKALGHDQFNNLEKLVSKLNGIHGNRTNEPNQIHIGAYDGDTPENLRAGIREKCHILLTNPDMVHLAILPHHTLWSNFFRYLRYVIIDEMHLYRGVFGSSVTNVIRRLKRIANFYNAYPQFILTSATIANSKELAEKIIEKDCVLIDNDGSPHGKKTFFLYNPPIIHEELGIRKSVTQETVRIAGDFLLNDIQSIVFTKTRRGVELLLKRMRESNTAQKEKISGYRSGYLPKERRLIEEGLRSGQIKTIIATNALELGIDIGGMDSVILAGYPGTIASTRQQAGRAGRRLGSSAVILVASANPLDQYMILHPEYLLERSPEKAFINPDNLLILLEHLRCAAFELPFEQPFVYGNLPETEINEFLQVLSNSGEIFQKDQKYYWVNDQYPSNRISLRSTSGKTVLLEAINEDVKSSIIGQVDEPSSYWMVHPHAIYLHEGQTFQVENYDFEKKRAILKPTNVDFFTLPQQKSEVSLDNLLKSEKFLPYQLNLGEITVTSQVTGYKKMLWETNEILGVEELEMPTSELHTIGCWICLTEELEQKMRETGMWSSNRNEYGKNWESIRNSIRERDQYTCQVCGRLESSTSHHVHHKIPFKNFTDAAIANRPDNLITLCYSCHQRAEAAIKIKSGLAGLAYTMQQLAPVFTMCDMKDLGVVCDPQLKLGEGRPTIVLYDQVPAGIGLSSQLYDDHRKLLASCLELVTNCRCKDGCPSCVGPSGNTEVGGKSETLQLLHCLIDMEII
jgi:DEAD/DEAH box helicase domain-containing protein